MKKDEIQIGKSYHNGKGQVRKVVDMVELVGYRSPDVLYEEGSQVGRLLLIAFAKWAKGEITCP